MEKCKECGAVHDDGITCQEDFYQMLFWEHEDSSLWEVHHLMVLCYHLQHPSIYTPEGLTGAQDILKGFMVDGLSTQDMRHKLRDKVDSGKRDFKITHGEPGRYDREIKWRMTAADVVAGGKSGYIENTRKWAQTVYDDLNNY